MRRWAEFVLTHRKWVMLFWAVVIVAGGAAAGAVSNRLTIDFSLPGQPGTEAAKKIKATFGSGGDTNPYVVTVTLPSGQTVAGNEAAVAKTFDAVAKVQINGAPLRVVDEADTGNKTALRTKDGRTAFAVVFYASSFSPTQVLPTKAIEGAARAAAPTGSVVGVTGEDALATGDDSGGPGVLGETLIGALGALIVLVFVFGSFLALLPLLVAAASILFTFILLWPITYATDVSFIVQFLIALVGLGVAIDYSLLLVTRWREERDHGRENHEAVIIAMETAGRAVVFSGVTVAIGLLALVVLPVPFMRSMGYGGALIPLASVLTTLSFTPAILGGIGPKVDWPKLRHENTASRSWSRWARLVVRRRWVAAILAVAGLVALVGVLFGVKIGLASSGSLAKSGPAYEALQTLKQGGVSTGVLTPVEVLTDTDRAASVAAKLGRVEGVDAALVPTESKSGRTVVVLLPGYETVNSQSVGVVKRVKSAAAGLDGVLGVTGIGAAQIDFLDAVYGNFPLMLLLIAVLTYLLLVRAFRSLLLPLKAVLLNILSLAATVGVMVLFWQYGKGSELIFGIKETGAITFWIPLMVFAFLFGLSMDYEVFILSRIREEYDGEMSTDDAVVEGIGRTGRLVTCAALILFLAFAALASGPGTDIKTLATGLGIGILLDATIVRSLLVPSLVSLFGSWNWYLPKGVAKVLRVEPSQGRPEPPRERVPELV